MTELYVDADACPVKDEALRVARRHGIALHVVGNQWFRGLDDPLVHQVVVGQGFDAADDWIADHAGAGDIVVTADILLADRCIRNGARVLGPNGRPFTPDSIGSAVAVREISAHLRDRGELTKGPPPFSKQDRSRFLDALENTVQAARRAQ